MLWWRRNQPRLLKLYVLQYEEKRISLLNLRRGLFGQSFSLTVLWRHVPAKALDLDGHLFGATAIKTY